VSIVAGWLLDSNNSAKLDASVTPEYAANLEQNLADAVARLPKLTTGADGAGTLEVPGSLPADTMHCQPTGTARHRIIAWLHCEHDMEHGHALRLSLRIGNVHSSAGMPRAHDLGFDGPNAGIDLNPRFHDCKAYEFTDEVAIFDLLGVPLLHGWLIDPQVLLPVSLTHNDILDPRTACHSSRSMSRMCGVSACMPQPEVSLLPHCLSDIVDAHRCTAVQTLTHLMRNPQDEEAVKVIGGASYNELLSRLISLLGDDAAPAAAAASDAAVSLASPPAAAAPAGRGAAEAGAAAQPQVCRRRVPPLWKAPLCHDLMPMSWDHAKILCAASQRFMKGLHLTSGSHAQKQPCIMLTHLAPLRRARATARGLSRWTPATTPSTSGCRLRWRCPSVSSLQRARTSMAVVAVDTCAKARGPAAPL